MSEFTHLNPEGRARMVDVSNKEVSVREARAEGEVRMALATVQMIRDGRAAKGDVLAVAQVAGIMGAKATPTIIPLCHPLPLSGIDLSFTLEEEPARVAIIATVRTTARTGVEMEALTAVTVAGLTIYDMCKAVDKAMEIGAVRLVKKTKTPLP